MDKNAAPSGFTTVTPYLVVKDVESLIKFLKEAFDGETVLELPGDDGKIRHAEVKIGNSMIMMGRGSDPDKHMSCMLYLYTEDTDKYYSKALAAGAESVREPEDQFYGDRTAAVSGPQKNIWYIAQSIENVSMDEVKERMKQQNE